MNTFFRYKKWGLSLCLFLSACSYLSAQFEGSAGSGQFALLASGSNCANFLGGNGSGYDSVVINNSNCPSFLGNLASGQAQAFLASAQNCLFFMGGQNSGQTRLLYSTPYTCTQFFASASGGSGHATRSYSEDNTGCAILSLPIESSPLFGELIDGKGYLHWQTFSELNNMGFDIQKSNNGIDWTNIGWVDGAGNSTNTLSYEFWDKNMTLDWQYYRFRQNDFNGIFTYSNIISLHGQQSNEQVDIFTVYPNPVASNQQLHLRAWIQKEWTMQIRVIDPLGRTLFQQVHLFQQGTDTYSIPSQLPAGNYWLLLESVEQHIRHTIPFIVVD